MVVVLIKGPEIGFTIWLADGGLDEERRLLDEGRKLLDETRRLLDEGDRLLDEGNRLLDEPIKYIRLA